MFLFYLFINWTHEGIFNFSNLLLFRSLYFPFSSHTLCCLTIDIFVDIFVNISLFFLPNTRLFTTMSLRVPSSDQSLSPSPHRQMAHFRAQHASSPCSSSASPSPSVSPLKQRRRKLNQFDSQGVGNQNSDKTLLNFSQNAPVNNINAPVYSRKYHQLSHDTSKDSNSDHIMSDVSSFISFSSQSSQSSNKNRRPLSASFTNNDPTFSKKLATSFLKSNTVSTSNSFSSTGTFSKSFDNIPHPRGLRRSAGLLNLEEASHDSKLARKSSYRSRRSYAKPSPSSVSSDFSKIDLSNHLDPSLQRQFRFSSTAPTLPQKRPHSFGSMFGENSSQQTSALKPNWNFAGDSTELSFRFDAKPGWKFSQQSRPTNSTPSPFFSQPYFNKSESLSSSLNSNCTAPRPNTPRSSSKPTQKLRKMGPENSNPSSPHIFSPHSPTFSRFDSSFSNQLSHPLAYSYPSSSPLTSPSRDGKQSQPVSPVVSSNNLRPQSRGFSFSTKPFFDFNKSTSKPNSSLEFEASSHNSTSEFSTPDSFKFVKPLQTAFMSTGLISKRNRKKPFGDSHMAPPDTPCKKTNFSSSFSNFSSDTKNTSSNSLCPSFSSSSSQFGGSSQYSSTSSRVSHTNYEKSVEHNNFNEFNCKEPSTPRKSASDYLKGDTYKYSALSMSVPNKTSNPISDSSNIVSGPFLSSSFTSNNSSSTSINQQLSSTPLSQFSRFHDGSPSDMSSPRTPYILLHDDVTQLGVSLHKDSVMQYGNNNEVADAGNIETPKTPAKASKFHNEIAIPSTMMGMEKMEQDDASDIVLRERYTDVQIIGTGEFSIVYAASERTTNSSFEPTRFAIKRTKLPFVGPKARARRYEEVEILRNLTYSNKSGDEDSREHIVNLIDAWELRGHLYIVTEYCENGNLDKFLSKRGNISRLDEWRVWKILVELSLVCF